MFEGREKQEVGVEEGSSATAWRAKRQVKEERAEG